jgi:tetratricopeptide (TPR) repeat protein
MSPFARLLLLCAWLTPCMVSAGEPTPPPAPIKPAAAAPRPDAEDAAGELINQGDIFVQRGELPQAVEAYSRAIAIDPWLAQAYRRRAVASAGLGDVVNARADYNRFLEIDPAARFRMEEEIGLYRHGSLPVTGNVAVPLPWGAICRSPVATADMYYAFARNDMRLGHLDSAQRLARRSDEELADVRTHALLAQTYFAKGQYRAAAAEARAAAAFGPLDAWQSLYELHGFEVSTYSQLLARLEQHVQQYPSSADAHFLLGYQYLLMDRKDAAHEQLAFAAVLEPADLVAKDLLKRGGVEIVAARARRPGEENVGQEPSSPQEAERPSSSPPAWSPPPAEPIPPVPSNPEARPEGKPENSPNGEPWV